MSGYGGGYGVTPAMAEKDASPRSPRRCRGIPKLSSPIWTVSAGSGRVPEKERRLMPPALAVAICRERGS